MSTFPGLSVFISSTCYDLLDLRDELSDVLSHDGFIVRRSEDPDSSFFVDPLDSSIQSCLRNVAASDAVVCLMDRRYGGVLKNEPNAGLSATHLEVRYAREIEKPVFFFVRAQSQTEFDLLKGTPDAKTRWVEPDEPSNREKWLGFMTEIAALPVHKGWSNWCDSFRTSVDLKSLVKKRLADYFPTQAGSLALHPDRVVRLTFRTGTANAESLRGEFENVGVGPAMNIRHGSQLGEHAFGVKHLGGLAEGRELVDAQKQQYLYPTVPKAACSEPVTGRRAVFCEYENRFGDKFRVEVELENTAGKWKPGTESFFVASGQNWLRVWPQPHLVDT